MKSLTLAIDGMPIEVFGRRGTLAFNGQSVSRIYSPMVGSVAKTGDRVGAMLKEGKAAPQRRSSAMESFIGRLTV